jgi:hypothetical protein
VEEDFGALVPIIGPLLTSFIALVIAVPVRFGIGRENRGAHPRAEERLHRGDLDAQDAAGGARVRIHGLHVSRPAHQFGITDTIFIKPKRKETEDYISGRLSRVVAGRSA